MQYMFQVAHLSIFRISPVTVMAKFIRESEKVKINLTGTQFVYDFCWRYSIYNFREYPYLQY